MATMATSHLDYTVDRPLAQAIAAATRSVHAELNKLIISRLPLALPPQVDDPSAYVSGLLHVAPVYITFEKLWQSILDCAPMPSAEREDEPTFNYSVFPPSDEDSATSTTRDEASNDQQPQACDRMHSLLQHLYIPDLMRTYSLKEDLGTLTGWDSLEVEEQLGIVSQTGRLGEFVSHIRRAVTQRPHVIVAYSYIMFMALFAGGRLIRAFLESVGDDFWETVPSPIQPTSKTCHSKDSRTQEHADGVETQPNHDTPFRFFHFATPMDGEDLKHEFKSRLADLEKSLTPREKRDIVKEAVCIFDNMRLVVRQLDLVCVSKEDEGAGEEGADLNTLSKLLKNPLGTRFRDSVAVTKARALRSSSKMSSSEESTSSVLRLSGDPTFRPDLDHLHYEKTRCPIQAHPTKPGLAGVKMCPAMSKTMRFDSTLPHPERHVLDRDIDIKETVNAVSRNLLTAQTTNLVVVVAFGAVILCALFTGHRGVLDGIISNGA